MLIAAALAFTLADRFAEIARTSGGRRLAIAVFVKDSTADEATRERAIAAAARAAYDAWVTK